MQLPDRRCNRCGEEKPSTEFGKNKTCRDGLNTCCRVCDRTRARAWRAANRTPEDHRVRMAAWKRDNPERYAELRFVWRTRKYGLTPERFHEMLAAQGGCCAACGSDDPNTSWGQFGIDHDHACCPGKCVRGLLCSGCNTALAHVKDDVQRLKSLIAYLERSV